MSDFFPAELSAFMKLETIQLVIRILIIVLGGLFATRLFIFLFSRAVKSVVSSKFQMLARKAIFYLGMIVVLMLVLNQLGMELTAILGAAGIAGIAIGFAAQTSISNIISGAFLISENSFAPGDVIRAGDTTGIVLSIDLLSVKLRTFDNQFVRVPNETLIKSDVTNITRFPIRRLNVELKVKYSEDLGKVRDILLQTAVRNPFCLDDPEPLFLLKDFGLYGVEILFGVWFAREDYLSLKNSIMTEIMARFREEGIEIPVPPVVAGGNAV